MTVPRFGSVPGNPEASPVIRDVERYLQYEVIGRVIGNVRTVTESGPLWESDYMVRVDATAGPVTMTLPPAISVPGQVIEVKKVDPTGNIVTLAADGTDLIDGASSYDLGTQYDSYTVLSYSDGWDIL